MKRNIISKTILIIIITAVSFLTASILNGCDGGAGTFLGGAATGAATANTIAGIQADLEAQRQRLLAKQSAILARLEQTNDIAERAVLEAENAALRKKLELNTATSTGIDLAGKATETDWTDLNETFPWINSGVMALFLFLTDKKKRNLSQLLVAVNEGIEKYKAISQPDQAQQLYEAIKERKQINGVN